MRILFIENEDSFSWNVVESLPFDRSEVRLIPGRTVAQNLGLLAEAQAVVLGPGPTDPVRAGLLGIVHAAARARQPLLGICLGHQALGLAFGARLARVPPVHGKPSEVSFSPSRCFPGIVGAQTVMRYHSLALAQVVAPLQVIATTHDGIIMGIEHEELPMAGLQFHPDSYASPRGREMVAAFFRALL